MLINDFFLYNIDDNNVNVFIIKNDVENVINKKKIIASIFYNVTNCF